MSRDAARSAVTQRGPQVAPAAVDAATHGPAPHTQRSGYLVVGEAVDVAEDDGRPGGRGQLVEGLPHLKG
jgi:hypothetical protein